jgi:hypothetical protein
MASNFGLSYITKLFYSVISIILLIIIYTYIVSLENKGCKCALPPNINFIKSFTIFAIIYLIFTGLVSDQAIKDNFGSNIVIINKFVDLIFALVFIYYLYEVFIYTRRLVNEKCKCSVDMRREIIMIGSIIELLLILVLFVIGIIITVVFSVFINIIKSIEDGSSDLKGVIRDPIGSISKIPKKIKDDIKEVSSYMKKTSKQLSKIKNLSR